MKTLRSAGKTKIFLDGKGQMFLWKLYFKKSLKSRFCLKFLLLFGLVFHFSLGAEEAVSCLGAGSCKVQDCQNAGTQAEKECIGTLSKNQQTVDMLVKAGILKSEGQGAYGLGKIGQSTEKLGSGLSAEILGVCKAASDQCFKVCEQAEKSDPFRADPATLQKVEEVKSSSCKPVGQIADLNGAEALATDTASDASGSTADAAQGGGGDTGGGDMGGGEGGGGLGQMAPLLGMGAAMAGACVVGKMGPCKEKEEEEEKVKEKKEKTTSVKEVDCSKKNAYKESECEEEFVDKCEINPQDKNCSLFAKHYCGLGEKSEGENSAGVGSYFCQIMTAYDYCMNGSSSEFQSGKEDCPTCKNLSRMNTEACFKDPGQCIPQLTTEDKEKVAVICPTDPLFSNPTFTTGSPSVPNGTGVVSHSSESKTNAASVSSLSSRQKRINRSRAWNRKKTKTSYGNAGLTSAAALDGRTPASPSVRVEVGAQLGPGLFRRHTEIVSQRCESGELSHCGPRKSLRGNSSSSQSSQ